MARTLFLIRFRQNPSVRAHFAVFVPSTIDPNKGTLIHVVGAPMVGFALEFQRGVKPQESRTYEDATALGQVHDGYVADPPSGANRLMDNSPRDALEKIASQVDPPRISQNFMAAVNDTTNRRCQEWTMDYLRRLAQQNVLDPAAIDTAQSLRDHPSHGVGLKRVGGNPNPGRLSLPEQAQQQAAAGPAAAPPPPPSAYAQSAAGQAPNPENANVRWDPRIQRYVTWNNAQQKWMYHDGSQWVLFMG